MLLIPHGQQWQRCWKIIVIKIKNKIQLAEEPIQQIKNRATLIIKEQIKISR